MLYITKRHILDSFTPIDRVYESPFPDLKERYKAELVNMAEEQGLVVNPNHPTIPMNHKHNSHLTKEDYTKKIIDWENFTNKFTFDFYIIKNKKELLIRQHNFIEI